MHRKQIFPFNELGEYLENFPLKGAFSTVTSNEKVCSSDYRLDLFFINKHLYINEIFIALSSIYYFSLNKSI